MTDVKHLILCFWLLLKHTAYSQLTVEQCGQCICNTKIGQYGKISNIANCSRSGIHSVPVNLPKSIHILDMSHNHVSNSSLKNLAMYRESLSSLSLAYINITHIDTSIFKTLIHLEELDLTGNILNYVDGELFAKLNLQILEGIHAKTFHPSSFRGLLGMETLSVVFEQNTIDKDIFKNLHIVALDVTFEKSVEIPSSLFRFGTNTLTTLSIHGPRLLSLPDDIFADLAILKTLTIRGNQIRFLSRSLLDRKEVNGTTLHVYKIRVYGVKSISHDFLRGQTNLKFVTLNGIEDIPPIELPNQLDCLDMSESQVNRILKDMFLNLHNLRKLYMSKTSLSIIDRGAFFGLMSLAFLDLSKNNISELSEDLFSSCKNTLEYLDLSHNNLQTILKLSFGSIKSLRYLDLSYNKIKYIEKNSFETLRMMASFLCAGNVITDLPDFLFSHLTSLQSVDLSDNNISMLPVYLFIGSNQLESVNFENNPLHCDCSVKLIKMYNRYAIILGVCKSPAMYKGILVKDLDIDKTCYNIRDAERSNKLMPSSTKKRLDETIHTMTVEAYWSATPELNVRPIDVFVAPTTTFITEIDDVYPTTPPERDVRQTQLDSRVSILDTDSLLFLNPTTTTSPCSSVYFKHIPHNVHAESSTDWSGSGFFIFYITISTVIIVVTVSVIFASRVLFEKVRRSGTYILPPPKL